MSTALRVKRTTMEATMARDARGEEPFKAAVNTTEVIVFSGWSVPLVAVTSALRQL